MGTSRRDRTIVARHEVPGKVSPRDPSRRVRCDKRYRDRVVIRVCTHRAEPLPIGPMGPIGPMDPMGRDSAPSSAGPTRSDPNGVAPLLIQAGSLCYHGDFGLIFGELQPKNGKSSSS